MAVRADVADDVDVKRLFDEAIEAFGGVDVVVHTVDGDAATPAEVELEDSLCRQPGDVDLGRQPAAVRRRRDRQPVQLDSVACRTREPRGVKAATEVLIRILALELRERDITVNGVALAVDGPCAPNRIADAVAYLVGDEGHGLTGQHDPHRRVRGTQPAEVTRAAYPKVNT